VDGRRRIGWLSPSKRGARHDKRLWDKSGVERHIPAQVSVLADSGFQGVRHPGFCLPHKGSRRKPLSDEQREWNGLLAGQRVVVEHAIGGMKRYGAVSGIYRNRRPKMDDQFHLLAAGLWNHFIN